MNQRSTASKYLIMHTASQMAKEQGWSSLSVRKIAERMGYTAPIIYEFFESRDDLIGHIVSAGFAEIRQSIKKKYSTLSPEILTQVCLEYWSFAHKSPEIYEAMSLFPGLKLTHEALKSEAMQLCQMISCFIVDWGKEYSVIIENPRQATDLLWAHLHGIVSLGLSNQLGSKKDVELLIRKSVSCFEAGLAK